MAFLMWHKTLSVLNCLYQKSNCRWCKNLSEVKISKPRVRARAGLPGAGHAPTSDFRRERFTGWFGDDLKNGETSLTWLRLPICSCMSGLRVTVVWCRKESKEGFSTNKYLRSRSLGDFLVRPSSGKSSSMSAFIDAMLFCSLAGYCSKSFTGRAYRHFLILSKAWPKPNGKRKFHWSLILKLVSPRPQLGLCRFTA